MARDEERPRVLVRIVLRPREISGEALAVYVDTRTVNDPSVVVYSVTRDEWYVEPHYRKLMWRTRRASPHERAEAVQSLSQIGEQVRILQSAPRAMETDEDLVR